MLIYISDHSDFSLTSFSHVSNSSCTNEVIIIDFIVRRTTDSAVLDEKALTQRLFGVKLLCVDLLNAKSV